MSFPLTRPRRNRLSNPLRRMVAETDLTVDRLIYPLFVTDGQNVKDPIKSMPGCFRFSVDTLIEEAKEVYSLGIPGVIIFGVTDIKDEYGSEAYNGEGIVAKAIRALKKEVPELLVWADVCMCEYTSHGHCGILHDGYVDNDETIISIAKSALVYARAGADMVAPSDMMDGRVKVIREALDNNGFKNTGIVSYSAKYASAFYGPFRDAAGSSPQSGDRKSYQMNPANSNEALLEVLEDIEEGADIVMVKPALSYLDIIAKVKQRSLVPVAAYNVSGEYSMVKAAAQNGWIDEQKVIYEMLLSIRRAGADIILTYFAKDAAIILKKRNF
ncbi:MAG: porphobilinogen synthase [Deltaproteobacteria bacterium]|nr:porphobilinogen synthase [Deltaproteobacteria bacterium]